MLHASLRPAWACAVILPLLSANYGAAQTFTSLLSFNTTDGANPYGDLLVSGSTLYGMTSENANFIPSNRGTIFSIATSGGNPTPTTLFSFSGTTGGFNINMLGNTNYFTQANNPLGGLTISGTTLYGMTTLGGASNHGNIFSIGTDGTGFTNLYSFTGGTDGAYPAGGLTLSGGTFYGMTWGGGTQGAGTVFALALSRAATTPIANQAVWTAGNGSWATGSNWIDTASGGPSGAPGLSGSAGDTATFGTASGSGSAAVTLDGAAPLLSGLIFGNSSVRYVLLQGSGTSGLTLTGTGGGSPVAVTVLSGTHSVEVPILLDCNLYVSSGGNLTLQGDIGDGGLGYSLTFSGPGTLVLGGTNGYRGGTMVASGTLIVDNSEALADGTSLTVGKASYFSASAPASASTSTSAAVPEPGSLLLLAFGLWSAAIYRRFPRRKAGCETLAR